MYHNIGTARSAAAHIPLALLPVSEVPIVGALIGTFTSTTRTVVNSSGSSAGFTDANQSFYNLRVISSGPVRVATINAGNLETVYVYPDGKQRYEGPLKPRQPGLN